MSIRSKKHTLFVNHAAKIITSVGEIQSIAITGKSFDPRPSIDNPARAYKQFDFNHHRTFPAFTWWWYGYTV
jgi:hypothetical protein